MKSNPEFLSTCGAPSATKVHPANVLLFGPLLRLTVSHSAGADGSNLIISKPIQMTKEHEFRYISSLFLNNIYLQYLCQFVLHFGMELKEVL